ncbi:cobalt transporter [Rhizobium sp. Leaf384]|uniref:CbtA family protein n=1 Tax=unclassified Rhizobium TaxID=2613769 RepID=UPI000715BC94|nr:MULTISPECIES: CbtA family protein [unclassified Rhizobium]KQS79452.1 cobalt transporter [Rhizobium sp. Leaf384]KQS85093.1 cobalt transporter [Rhizobium sp. Leaf383]
MIVRTLLAAICAGLIAGIFMTAAQELRLTPLILKAETYEAAPGSGATPAHEHSSRASDTFLQSLAAALDPIPAAYAHDGAEHEEGGTLFGMSRFSGTLIANLVTGAGFGLILGGLGIALGRPPTLRTGLAWGALGWLSVHLLPALGLPPELPGFPAGDLADRQTWWLMTTVLSAIGLGIIALRKEIWAKAAGLGLLAVPHLYGAPQPGDLASPVPAVLGAEFAVAALATTLAFWLVLGTVSGAINDRFVPKT